MSEYKWTHENTGVAGFVVGVVFVIVLGLILMPTEEETLTKYGCEFVPIETKVRRVEIGIQGLEGRLIGIEAKLDRLVGE